MSSTQSIDGRQGTANWHRRLAATSGVYAAVAGFVTLVGWAASMPWLTDWKKDGISMFPNTAVCAMLSGLAVLLAGAQSSPRLSHAALVGRQAVGLDPEPPEAAIHGHAAKQGVGH